MKIEDKTGYEINLHILGKLAEIDPYWEKAHKFVNDMQGRQTFTSKQEDWLDSISLSHTNAYLELTK